ncbi:MAG: ATP-binding protein [Bacteroidota bacterium]
MDDFLKNASVDVASKMFKDDRGDIWLNVRPNKRLLKITFPSDIGFTGNQTDHFVNKIEIAEAVDGGKWIASLDSSKLLIEHWGKLEVLDAESFIASAVEKESIWSSLEGTSEFVVQDDLIQKREQILVKREDKWTSYLTDFPISFSLYDRTKDQIWVQNLLDRKVYLYKLTDFEESQILLPKSAHLVLADDEKSIISGLIDETGVVWFGTGGYGLQKIVPRALLISHHLPGESIYDYPFVVDHGEILLNRLRGKLYYEPGQRKKLEKIYDYLSPLEWGKNFRLARWSRDSIWLASLENRKVNNENKYQHTLNLLLSTDQDLDTRFKVQLTDKSEKAIFNLAVNTDGSELFLLLKDQLTLIDLQDWTVNKFEVKIPISPRLQFYNAVQTEDGSWWLGSNYGLIRFKLNDIGLKCEILTISNSDLSNNECASLLIDRNDADVIWIGTKGGGLNRLDTRSGDWYTLGKDQGLPDNVIYGVLADENGCLWMSSNKGIIQYNPSNNEIRQYTEEDGLQSNEFNTYAYAQSPDGAMYFGGINGLNSFYPEDLISKEVSSKATIVSLSINDEIILPVDSQQILSEDIVFSEQLNLDYSQNSISLRFSYLDFTGGRKTRFQYYLEGLEEQWKHETKDRQATYLSLPPGNYIFKLRASHTNGIWSNEIRSLKIVIKPPWYRTWMAYLAYLAIALLLIRWYVNQQRRRYELKQAIVHEKQEAERLRKAQSFRKRLYDNLTHEFRTPLTVIMGVAKQLRSERPSTSQSEKLDLLTQSSENLLQLVNEQLDVARGQSKNMRLNLSKSDLSNFLTEVTNSLQPIVKENSLEIVLKRPPQALMVDYDRKKVWQIITNLISNAIKYSNPGSRIIVELSKLDSSLVELRVTDFGKGVPPAEVPFIFDRFYQSENVENIANSSGIGLAYTKELVELHGGQITVQSKLGQGSTFELKIPITHSGYTISDSISKVSDTNGGLQNEDEREKLLIIEDSHEVVSFLQLCFKEQYKIACAYDGETGIALAQETIPDLVISDVMMPGKSGYELCEVLKLDERTSHIPIILLTAKADVEDRITGLKRGADIYMGKPFDEDELLLQVGNLLKLKQQWQSRYESLDHIPESDNEKVDQEDAFIEKVKHVIESNLQEDQFDIQSLCQEVGMSRSQLHLKLKALTGRSTSHFIRQVRINRAKNLLQTSPMSISEIAYTVGFSSRTYFSRVFSEELGMSPKDYREKSG